ncbi:nicotinate (nicotinamide) nucleotide adenylyltransferase [Marinilabilia rubra]|uniref:Probable nicotinate-nucleotide adenylyltransferase n=1 Tax=Marinilabilia rubra TaxID=2162893 RepID=A0A2U2B706_9BACT|nr:nicotinate (nicotinamide) nucleotide adenylyltransferase [Marinilabilia rubra]PWD98824.1 nicotinic acid mononucleotide adenylyltransferase [Marinilabilia rubra]
MKKTGLLFGSFNPIHIGHLALANYLMEYAPFDEVWFMVSPQNPFKEHSELAPADQRLEMVKLATGIEPKFKVCDLEFDMPVPSYTINTLKRLSELHPDHQFSLITGSDNILTFPRWHKSEEILNNYPIVVYPRPGYEVNEANTGLSKFVKVVEAPLLDISSTLIRNGLNNHKNLRFLLPYGIFDFILKEGLYLPSS